MRSIRLTAITDKGKEALENINKKNNSLKNRVKVRIAQGLNKSLFKRAGMDYEEAFDEINYVYLITFTFDADSALRLAREKLDKLMLDNGASFYDYSIEVF
jgi:hypothetical protein